MDPSVDEDDMRVDGGDGVLGEHVGVGGGVGGIPGEGMDQERRIRREIANSNERRRMQSINAGFQSLRTLLPHHEGEKLSKAAILQQTAEYIYTLEQEKTLLLSQNSQLKRLLSLNQQRLEGGDGLDTSPQMKKKRYGTQSSTSETGSSDVTTSRPAEVNGMTDLGHETVETGTVTDINLQLMQEQRLRLRLEERVKSLERQLSMSSTVGGGVVSTGNGTTITLPSKPEPPKNLTLLATTTTTAQQPQPDLRAEPHRATTTRIMSATAGGTTILLQPPPQTPTAEVKPAAALQQPAAVTAVTVQPAPTVTPVTTSTTVATAVSAVPVPPSVLQAAVAASKKEVGETLGQSCNPALQQNSSPMIRVQQAVQPQPQQVVGGVTAVQVAERISSLQPQPPPLQQAPLQQPSQQQQPVLPSMPLPLAAAVKAADSSELVIRDPMDGVERSYTVTTAAGNNSRQNLDSIVEAIRHLEGDHLFSEDRVVKEEVVDYSTTENTIQVPNSKAAAAIASIQLPQEPVSISSATISRGGPSNTGGIIIIKQP